LTGKVENFTTINGFSRQLDLVFPTGVTDPYYLAKINALKIYGASKGIFVNVKDIL
jgi:hypothetical protein